MWQMMMTYTSYMLKELWVFKIIIIYAFFGRIYR
jgi:hypothetical protein